MNIEKLIEGLSEVFNRERHRIVFWYDPDNTFESHLTEIELPDVNIINMRNQSSLDIKIIIERDNLSERYLLYFPSAEPSPIDDWLLDIKLYSRCFRADNISMIFDDLGLEDQSIRDHLVLRERFFNDKQRTRTLKKWLKSSATQDEVDMAMLAVLSRAEQPDLPHVLFALTKDLVKNDCGLGQNTGLLESLSQYGLDVYLIKKLQTEYGYPATEQEITGEKQFVLGNFLIQLLVTGFIESTGDIPDWAGSHLLKGTNALATARALLSHWRDSAKYYPSFDKISEWVSETVRIDRKLSLLTTATLVNDETFEQVERQIILDLESVIPNSGIKDLNHHLEIINTRYDSYWASRHHDDATRKKYRLIYRALSAAIELFKLRIQFDTGFHSSTLEELYREYTGEIFKFDFNYRHYCVASQLASVEILKTLDNAVENCYSEWYLDHLAINLGDIVKSESCFDNWWIENVPNQYDFFNHFIQPILKDKKSKRVVVIISDAFRYEAAIELRERINEKRYNEATLSSQLGVLPSYTGLGMAALLPHESLQYTNKDGDDVYVDGVSTKGTAARNKILAKHDGIAITAKEIQQWSKEEGREAIKDSNLIYIYHNVIDARGDSASTESETFLAVEQAINELSGLVSKVISNYNISRVIITADHGFLFQKSKLESADRSNLDEMPKNAFKSKKRYVIGNNLPIPKDAWSGNIRNTANSNCDTQFWIPKGINRFHFVGGARFVHGGAMPQEIVVPVLIVKGLRGKKAEQRTKRKVGVISATSSLKMVTNIQKFDFIQTDTVNDQLLPITISIGIYDGQNLVSSEEKSTFNSKSDSINERRKSVRLSLSGKNFDRKKDYFMVLKDIDINNVEIERYRIIIDLAFADDFLE